MDSLGVYPFFLSKATRSNLKLTASLDGKSLPQSKDWISIIQSCIIPI